MFMPQLLLGWPCWPSGSGLTRERLWEGIQAVEGQVRASTAQLRSWQFFGIAFYLPPGDPLGTYVSSLQVECFGLNPVPEIDEVIRVRGEIAALGLRLDRIRYPDLCSSHLPLDFFSAWGYVTARELEVVVPQGHHPTELQSRAELGLLSSQDARAYVEGAWERFSMCPSEEAGAVAFA